MAKPKSSLTIEIFFILSFIICDLPRENRPSSHLVMIVEIPVLKFLIGTFACVRPTISGRTGHNSLLAFL